MWILNKYKNIKKSKIFITKLGIIHTFKTKYSNSINWMKLKTISYLYLIDFKLLARIWSN